MGKQIPVCKLKGTALDIEIVCAGDVHWGSHECHEERFMKTLNYVFKRKNTYLILTGDLCEMATRSQSGEQLLQQIKPPTQQILEMKQMLEPLAKKGKILGYLRDNHIQRSERDAMVDLNAILSDSLNVPYWGVGGIVRIQIDSKWYKIAIQHGKDSNKNEFTKLDDMLMIYPDCDIYILAHDHKLSARKIVTMHYDDSGEECGRERWQIRSGSYLRYAQYARERLYRPSVIGSPIISFKEDGRVKIDIETLSWSH